MGRSSVRINPVAFLFVFSGEKNIPQCDYNHSFFQLRFICLEEGYGICLVVFLRARVVDSQKTEIDFVFGKARRHSPFNPVELSTGGISEEGPEASISARVVRFLLFNNPCFKPKLDADTNIFSKKSVDDTINNSTHISFEAYKTRTYLKIYSRLLSKLKLSHGFTTQSTNSRKFSNF